MFSLSDFACVLASFSAEDPDEAFAHLREHTAGNWARLWGELAETHGYRGSVLSLHLVVPVLVYFEAASLRLLAHVSPELYAETERKAAQFRELAQQHTEAVLATEEKGDGGGFSWVQ